MELYGKKELLDGIRIVRKNTIQIAEDIPEEKYDYRPTPDSRSVAELLVHIAFLARGTRLIYAERSLEKYDFGELIGRSEELERRRHSKEEVLELLRHEGDAWYEWVAILPEEQLAQQIRMPSGVVRSRFEMLLGTKEHEMHHRAQLTVFERLLGIVPHLTRQHQAMRVKVQ
jgi:uncharacterized damage-inducible protein DinB